MDLRQIFRVGRSTAADEQFFDSSTNFVDLIDLIELLPHS